MSGPPTPTALARALAALADGVPLDAALATDAFTELVGGRASALGAAALLMGLRARGETADELAAAARALRMAMITVDPGRPAVDTCGTGGGTVPTFNVSTAAALVAVGAGAVVAKHGNRSYTSRCGSADVLEALGIDIAVDAARAEQLLQSVGMAFLFAPAFHPAMKAVVPVRRALGVPTIMNLVGPLANPAGVRRQVVGVADAARAPIVAGALARLGAEHAMVVHGVAGLDEVSPAGPTRVWEIRDGTVMEWTIHAEDHGLGGDRLADLAGADPPENAARIRNLVAAPADDPSGRAAVVLNAGAAVYVAGLASSYAEGVRVATDALDGGAARAALDRLCAEGASTS